MLGDPWGSPSLLHGRGSGVCVCSGLVTCCRTGASACVMGRVPTPCTQGCAAGRWDSSGATVRALTLATLVWHWSGTGHSWGWRAGDKDSPRGGGSAQHGSDQQASHERGRAAGSSLNKRSFVWGMFCLSQQHPAWVPPHRQSHPQPRQDRGSGRRHLVVPWDGDVPRVGSAELGAPRAALTAGPFPPSLGTSAHVQPSNSEPTVRGRRQQSWAGGCHHAPDPAGAMPARPPGGSRSQAGAAGEAGCAGTRRGRPGAPAPGAGSGEVPRPPRAPGPWHGAGRVQRAPRVQLSTQPRTGCVYGAQGARHAECAHPMAVLNLFFQLST